MSRLKNLKRRPFKENGAILVLSSMAMVLMMGMAAFAVDYGWLAYNQLEVRKAAESAALAGVVHMPLPGGSTTWGAGVDAYDTAVDVAGRNGFVSGVSGVIVSPTQTGSSHQIRVTITDEIDTFFLRMFIGDTVTVAGSATAEQLPPLKLGSDESHLGGVADHFFVAINGERTAKVLGDPFSTRCGFGVHRCSTHANVGTGPLQEFRDPAYYYAIHVPEGQTGNLVVEIWDGTHLGGRDLGESNIPRDNWILTFELFAPDNTPNDWTDNSDSATPVCSETFYRDGTHGRPEGWGLEEWISLGGCGSAVSGIYVLEVSIDGNDASVSAFAIRATVGGTQNVAVYGLGAMSLWMPVDDTSPSFKIARLDEIYAGTELQLGLFDPGDSSGHVYLEFGGSLSGIDCQVRVRWNNGTVSNWESDGWWNSNRSALRGGTADWAGSSCGITTSQTGNTQIYNGDWLDLRFQIPPNHSCSGADCWSVVRYDLVGGSVGERTTWTATINGTPVHLKP